MFLPLSDAPNPPGTPIVNYGLIAVCVAVYLLVNIPLGLQHPGPNDPRLLEYLQVVGPDLLQRVPLETLRQQVTDYDLFVFEHGFRPAEPSLTALAVSMFLHGGFMHLFGNMLFLWIYGDNVEDRLGRFRYLLAYLGTGAAATLFFALFARGSQVPMIGASGAISGVLGFYFIWFPRNMVRIFVFLFPIWVDTIQVSARLVLGLYLVAENLLPFLFAGGGGGGGVAYGAHIGGFLAGVGIAWVMNRRQVEQRPRAYREPVEKPDEGDLGDQLSRALAAGEAARAARIYFSLPAPRTRRILSPEHSLKLADWLTRNGHEQAGLTVYRRHLRDYPTGPGTAEAHLGTGLIQLHSLGQVAPAYQHLLEALDEDPSPEVAAQARAALAEIAALQRWNRRAT